MIGDRADSFRIGCVQYLNAQPLIHGWPGHVVFDHPAVLCRKLANAELDVALVSSFEFLRNPVYAIVDGVAVAAASQVYSVFLTHAGPIEQLEEIALDPASNTSVNLLRCLVAEYGWQPRFVEAADGDLHVDAKRGRLLIGDQAIRFRQGHGATLKFWDLGAAWRGLTSLPFVFALWLIRPEVADPGAIADLLRSRRDENVLGLDRVIADEKEFDPDFCAYYFRECLRFSFADDEKRGLLMFRSLCEKHGILGPNAAPLQLI